MANDPYNVPGTPPEATRRDFVESAVKGAIGVSVALTVPAAQLARAAEKKVVDPARKKPQDGDVLVFTKGERKGEEVLLEDLEVGGQPIIAFPKDPETGIIRKGSRLNRVSVIRVDPARITERMQPNAADGVVAYSAICTHGGCLVEMWREEDEALFCPCHYSRYDAWDDGAVKGGPAPRKLASLPLKIVDGRLTIAGTFNGRVGNR